MEFDDFPLSMSLTGEIGAVRQLREGTKFGLLIGSNSGTGQLLPLVAFLALTGSVNVLDAGNHFDLIQVAYTIRRATPDLFEVEKRIGVVRAFTCIEAVKGLQQMPSGSPLVILDLLATFYDDAVSDKRCFLLVQECLHQIQRLKTTASVVASVRNDCPPNSPRAGLLPLLRGGADIVDIQPVEQSSMQSRMF